jgi:hypothetical protein
VRSAGATGFASIAEFGSRPGHGRQRDHAGGRARRLDSTRPGRADRCCIRSADVYDTASLRRQPARRPSQRSASSSVTYRRSLPMSPDRPRSTDAGSGATDAGRMAVAAGSPRRRRRPRSTGATRSTANEEERA